MLKKKKKPPNSQFSELRSGIIDHISVTDQPPTPPIGSVVVPKDPKCFNSSPASLNLTSPRFFHRWFLIPSRRFSVTFDSVLAKRPFKRLFNAQQHESDGGIIPDKAQPEESTPS